MPGQRFVWTVMKDAHLRRLRAEGYSISEMARELRASQHMVQVRVREQKAEEREAKAAEVREAPAAIHPGWLSMETHEP